MFQNNSPMEYLGAFAIAFLAGAITAGGLGWHMSKVKKTMANTTALSIQE